MTRSRRKSENIRRKSPRVSTRSWNPNGGLAVSGDDIVVRCEYAVRVAPGRNLFQNDISVNPVLSTNPIPYRTLSAMDRASSYAWRTYFHSEKLANWAICLQRIRSLLVMLKPGGAFRIRRHPCDGLGQKGGIRTLVGAV